MLGGVGKKCALPLPPTEEFDINTIKAVMPLIIAATITCAGQMTLAADQSQMMVTCNTYAARHLHVSESDITDLSYEGQPTDGTHAVNGTARNGQTFQCSFNAKGTHVVQWTHQAPQGCPPDVSQADRYLYPDCG